MCSITGIGERLHKVFVQIESKVWFPWQQKSPIDLQWGKQCLHLFSFVFDQIFFKLAGNEDRHKVLDKFEFPPDRTTLYWVRCPWASKKISHRLIMGKWCLQASSFIFDQVFVKLAGNQERHKISNELEFRPDRISHFGVTRLWGRIMFSTDLLWNRQDQFASLDQNYMYHQWDGGKAAFRFWSRFHQNCGCHGNRKLPLTFNGENNISMLTPQFWSDLCQTYK